MSRCQRVAGVLVLLVSSTSAQDPPRGRSQPFGALGSPDILGSPVTLMHRPEVRKELNISDEQNKQVDDALAQVAEAVGSFPQNLQNLTDEERQKRRTKFFEAIKTAEDKLDKILNREQLLRLKQLSMQLLGVNALTLPDVVKELGISQEQQDKIWKIQQESRRQVQVYVGSVSAEEVQKWVAEMRKAREKAQADVLALLSDEQKTKWADMKGKDFTFQPLWLRYEPGSTEFGD